MTASQGCDIRGTTCECNVIVSTKDLRRFYSMSVNALHLQMWSIICNGGDENQANRYDPYGP